jgi:hypothetical protein
MRFLTDDQLKTYLEFKPKSCRYLKIPISCEYESGVLTPRHAEYNKYCHFGLFEVDKNKKLTLKYYTKYKIGFFGEILYEFSHNVIYILHENKNHFLE